MLPLLIINTIVVVVAVVVVVAAVVAIVVVVVVIIVVVVGVTVLLLLMMLLFLYLDSLTYFHTLPQRMLTNLSSMLINILYSEHLVLARRFETYIKFFDGFYKKMT